MLRSLISVAAIIVVVVVVGLGVLALSSQDSDSPGEKEGGPSAEGKANSHPEGETLVFRFREMFDFQEAAGVGDDAAMRGITPIVTSGGSRNPIALADLLILSGELDRDVAFLADGTTQMEQAVGWFLYEGCLHYIVLVRPYEAGAHQLMQRPGEDLFLSFVNGKDERVVPRSAPERIPMSSLRVAVTSGGQPAGWVTYGELPLPEGAEGGLNEPKVGWIFSGTLHARLQKLQRGHMVRELGISDPFALDFETATKQK